MERKNFFLTAIVLNAIGLILTVTGRDEKPITKAERVAGDNISQKDIGLVLILAGWAAGIAGAVKKT